MIVLRVVLALAGLALVFVTMGSAVRSVVLPRAVTARIARVTLDALRGVFRLRTGKAPSYEKSDRVMAMYGPTSMLVLLSVWLLLVFSGFGVTYWALRPSDGWRHAVRLSGASLLTLGNEASGAMLPTVISFAEAATGLVLLALLITYLPSIYNSFSKRESMVALLEVRAGSPPSAANMIERFHRIKTLDDMGEQWPAWETWFTDIEESHTTFPVLAMFRSPLPQRSWITAAGAVLDTAAVVVSTVDRPNDPEAQLCLRAGYLSLQRIAAFFSLPFDPNPRPDDPISIAKEEFLELYDRLEASGIALYPDRDQCWRDFKGWRVNYDEPLLRLARYLLAPEAPWSSDRSLMEPRRLAAVKERLRRNGR